PVIVVVAFVQGLALAMHLTLWFTAFQQQVPEDARSRVSAYDAMGSFVFIPLGSAFAGFIASAIGPRTTLIAAGSLAIAANFLIFSRRSIYAIERRDVPQTA
ncbi:MAG: MFS transporter, partial [Gaiellaceae bacterium]